MKDSLIVLGIFVGGCLLGVLGYFPLDLKTALIPQHYYKIFFLST